MIDAGTLRKWESIEGTDRDYPRSTEAWEELDRLVRVASACPGVDVQRVHDHSDLFLVVRIRPVVPSITSLSATPVRDDEPFRFHVPTSGIYEFRAYYSVSDPDPGRLFRTDLT